MVSVAFAFFLAGLLTRSEHPLRDSSVIARTPDKFVLTTETGKKAFALYEPVVITYSVVNPTNEVIRGIVRMAVENRRIDFSITDPQGMTHPYQSGEIADGVLLERDFPPGLVGISEVEMIWNAATREFSFPGPGRYTIRARMSVGSALSKDSIQSSYLTAAPIEIVVTDPSGVDLEAMRFFSSVEDFKRLVRYGAGEYCKGTPAVECFDQLSSFLHQHPDSAYTPEILWDLAESVATGMLDVSPRSQTAIDLYSTFLRRWNNHPAAPRVMYRLAMALDAAGRKQEAVDLVGRFETTFPGRQDLLDQMRMNILHVRPLNQSPIPKS